jgi:hypothetical protein
MLIFFDYQIAKVFPRFLKYPFFKFPLVVYELCLSAPPAPATLCLAR